MKSLKEMKVALTASEMNHITGGGEIEAINPEWIDDCIDEPNRAAKDYKTVSSDCPNSSGTQNCRTISGAFKWCMGQMADYGPPLYH